MLEGLVLEHGYPTKVKSQFKIGKEQGDGIWDVETGFFLTLDKNKKIVKALYGMTEIPQWEIEQ